MGVSSAAMGLEEFSLPAQGSASNELEIIVLRRPFQEFSKA